MNKNYLILFIIILALVVSNCMSKKEHMEQNNENMAVVKAKVFLKGDPISEIFQFKKKAAGDIPLVEKDVAKTIASTVKSKQIKTKAIISEEKPNTVKAEMLKKKLLKIQDEKYVIKGKKLSNMDKLK